MSREIRSLRILGWGEDGGFGCWEEACWGVLWVGECGSRALEGLRSRRLASARSSSVVIASSWGVCGAGRRSPRLWLLRGLLVGLVAAR